MTTPKNARRLARRALLGSVATSTLLLAGSPLAASAQTAESGTIVNLPGFGECSVAINADLVEATVDVTCDDVQAGAEVEIFLGDELLGVLVGLPDGLLGSLPAGDLTDDLLDDVLGDLPLGQVSLLEALANGLLDGLSLEDLLVGDLPVGDLPLGDVVGDVALGDVLALLPVGDLPLGDLPLDGIVGDDIGGQLDLGALVDHLLQGDLLDDLLGDRALDELLGDGILGDLLSIDDGELLELLDEVSVGELLGLLSLDELLALVPIGDLPVGDLPLGDLPLDTVVGPLSLGDLVELVPVGELPLGDLDLETLLGGHIVDELDGTLASARASATAMLTAGGETHEAKVDGNAAVGTDGVDADAAVAGDDADALAHVSIPLPDTIDLDDLAALGALGSLTAVTGDLTEDLGTLDVLRASDNRPGSSAGSPLGDLAVLAPIAAALGIILVGGTTVQVARRRMSEG